MGNRVALFPAPLAKHFMRQFGFQEGDELPGNVGVFGKRGDGDGRSAVESLRFR